MRRCLTFGMMLVLPCSLFAADAVTYAKNVQPVLADRCYSCHGAEKQKGGLRLDSIEGIIKGGKKGPILTPGNPSKSTLYSLTLLPAGDDDRMPAKGDPLTQAQTDALREWIAAGAIFNGIAVAAPAPDKEAKPVAAAASLHLEPTDIDQASAKLSKPDAGEIKILKDAGAVISNISATGTALEVDLSHLEQPLNAGQLKHLESLANHVFWLDLHGSAITDAGLVSVAKCKNLQRLNLSRTAITDAGLATLKGNAQLKSLNLVSTAITDAGLSHLAAFKKLEKLYLMQSKVTESGMEKLAKTLPELTINHGPHFSTVTVEEPTGGKKKKKK
jgi:mono/diheme cytochrome c family protein